MQEKARLTYSYIRQSYRQLLKINQALDELIADHTQQINGRAVIVFGPQDEIREIITQRLHDLDLNYETYTGLNSFNNQVNNPADSLIITWREEEEEALPTNPRTVNIMKLL